MEQLFNCLTWYSGKLDRPQRVGEFLNKLYQVIPL